MALVFWLSAQPSLPRVTDRLGDLPSIAGHVVEYAVLALLLQRVLIGAPSVVNNSGFARASRWAFVIAVAYGVTDEVHQRWVPGRHMDPFDLFTDAAAAVAALLIVGEVRRRQSAALPEECGTSADLSEQA
jgi:VanZ family protein